ncbi:MAG: B12-binding domain-containing radical SAM protein [Elusimicrobia bacterium]|nr:B12-binding domain-containing radical SAM protein [Elusimicrobiota bacterium]
MKILFVNPPSPVTYYNKEVYPPSSLLYLAAVLKNNGEEVRILDLKCPKYENKDNPQKNYEDTLINTISDFQPDIIGFGCLFSGNFPELLKLANISKKNFRDIPIVIGGIHPTIYAAEILKNCPSIDWAILGEGEESVVQLINSIKSDTYKFEKIDGFAYRKNEKPIVNLKTSFIKNPDTIPFPAYDLIDLKDYYVDTSAWHNPKKLPINTSVPIITSRSCPNRCRFCSMYMVMGPHWRPRSPKNVVEEIEFVYNKYNHRHFSFMDDNLTLKKSHAMEICNQIIKKNLTIQFETPNGLAINTLDEEVLDALVAAGMVRTGLAIESGSDFIRNKIMRKNLSKEKIYQVVDLTRKYKDLFVTAFFIMGMPEETKETLMDTYNMIKDINVNKVILMNIVPFPGTEVFKQALSDNLLVDPDIKNMYLTGERYFTNYQKFFIKPYKMELKDLIEFRNKYDRLRAEQTGTAGKGIK